MRDNNIRTAFSEDVWNRISRIYRCWQQEIQWRLKKESWISARRISKYRNIHNDQRCFIIGNGPSLGKMNLSQLKNEFTFGLNRIYLLFPELGFQTTYHVCVNPLVIEQFANEIGSLTMPQFLSRRGYGIAKFNENTMFLHPRAGLYFSKCPQFYIYEGATVTYTAMQLAFYMGFRQIVLIGVDHYFVTKGTPHKEVTSVGDDPNHFVHNYFGKGVRWQLPDLETSENAYSLAKDIFFADDRSIVDATEGGKLTVFTKVKFETLFGKGT